MENTGKKSSDARIRANAKYNAKTYKIFSVNAKFDEYDKITAYCKQHDISKAQLLLRSAKYCIENNIDISAIDWRQLYI